MLAGWKGFGTLRQFMGNQLSWSEWLRELTEVEKREDLRGGGGLDLRLDDGGSWTIQRAGFLRLDTAIT